MTEQTPFALPSRNDKLIEFLKSRRSNLAKSMEEPGPNSEVLEEILTIGTRVPDHRKLAPWRFIVFEGGSRQKIGAHLGSVFKKKNPDMPVDRVIFESERFLRAPVIVGVVSSPVDCVRGTPEWEQRLSSAAVCYNICLAAQAHGYGAQWLTEWYAYDVDILSELGLSEKEQIAGFIYMGTPSLASLPRQRPVLAPLITKY